MTFWVSRKTNHSQEQESQQAYREILNGLTRDDIEFIRRRQDWRHTVARICLELFEELEEGYLESLLESGRQIGPLKKTFFPMSNYVEASLRRLLRSNPGLEDLLPKSEQVNLFLEEIIHQLKVRVQDRGNDKTPLLTLKSHPNQLKAEVQSTIEDMAEEFVDFIENLLSLGQFTAEVRNQQQRVRILLTAQRTLEEIYPPKDKVPHSKIDAFWTDIDLFRFLLDFLYSRLRPLLDIHSPYPEIQEELVRLKNSLQVLFDFDVEPFKASCQSAFKIDHFFRNLRAELRSLPHSFEDYREKLLPPLVDWAESRKLDSLQLYMPTRFSELFALRSNLNLVADNLRNTLRFLGNEPRLQSLRDNQIEIGELGIDTEESLRYLRHAIGKIEDKTKNRLSPQVALLGKIVENLAVLGEQDFDDLGEILGALGTSLAEIAAILQCPEISSALRTAELINVILFKNKYFPMGGIVRELLQTSFSELVAADPRSTHNSEYFFKREFSRGLERDLELREAVDELKAQLRILGAFEIGAHPVEPGNIETILDELFPADSPPPSSENSPSILQLRKFCEKIRDQLVPTIHKVCFLQSVRYEDKVSLYERANSLLIHATMLIDRCSSGAPVTSRGVLRRIFDGFLDLGSFVEFMSAGIRKRATIYVQEKSSVAIE